MKQKASIANYIAVLLVFLFSSAGTFMNAAMQDMIEAWPALSPTMVRMSTTLPPLISLPVMLIIGLVVGKWISYRFCALLGMLLIAFGGTAPYFFHSSWKIVIVFRVILGIGVGFLGIRSSLLIKSVPTEKQATYIGYGSMLATIGTVIASPIVGYLAEISWYHGFLFNALSLLLFIYIFFTLLEPEKGEDNVNSYKIAKNVKGRYGWRMIYYTVMQFTTCTAVFSICSGMTTYFADKKLGSALLAGSMISIYTLSGACINLIIGPVLKIFKGKTIAFLCLVSAVGLFLILVPSYTVVIVGVALAGIGFCGNMSVFQIYNGEIAPPNLLALSSSFILAAIQGGVFASNYFIAVSHIIFNRDTDIESSFLGGSFAFIIMAVIAFICKVAPEES